MSSRETNSGKQPNSTHLDILARPNLTDRSQVSLQLRLEVLCSWLAVPPPSLIRFASRKRRQAERMCAAFAADDLVSWPGLCGRVCVQGQLVCMYAGDASRRKRMTDEFLVFGAAEIQVDVRLAGAGRAS